MGVSLQILEWQRVLDLRLLAEKGRVRPYCRR